MGELVMILGFHSIAGAYGFWLPNDPRGSWSDFVASWELFRYGPATKTDTRRSVAHVRHDAAARLKAKEGLKYPPVELTGVQARAVAHGFAEAMRQSGYHVLACAILPEHFHLVTGWQPRSIRRVLGHFKGRATHHLIKESLWPDPKRPVWGEKGWNVYIDSLAHLQAAIAYVENNPMKEGKKRQQWSFITPLDVYLKLI
jgi:REP-associated tyrosine transposase